MAAILLFAACGPGGGGGTSDDGSYFRFTVEGREYEAEEAQLSVSPLGEGQHVILINSRRSGGGPGVSAIWRMPLAGPLALEDMEVTARDLQADPSATFVLITEGEAGAAVVPGTSFSLRFRSVGDGYAEGSFTAGGLEFTESYAASPGDAPRTVSASGAFRMGLGGS